MRNSQTETKWDWRTYFAKYCNPGHREAGVWKAKAEDSQVSGHPEPHRETLLKKRWGRKKKGDGREERKEKKGGKALWNILG